MSAAALLPSGVAHSLGIGDAAPPFSVPATTGKQSGNKDFPGKTLVLFFYPGAFTNGCTQEALTFQLELHKFEAANAQVLGISVDFNATNEAWAQKLGLKFPLLADTRREVSRAYGVLNDDPALAKDPERIQSYLRAIPAVIVVDKDGVVRYIRDSRPRNTIPVDEILTLVEAMK